MPYTYLGWLEEAAPLFSDALERVLVELYELPEQQKQLDRGHIQRILRQQEKLHESFTENASHSLKSYMQERDSLAGYLLFYVYRNALKIFWIYLDAYQRGQWSVKSDKIVLVDVGAGPLSAAIGRYLFEVWARCQKSAESVAIAAAFKQPLRFEVHAFDLSLQSMQVGKKLIHLLGDAFKKKWQIESQITVVFHVSKPTLVSLGQKLSQLSLQIAEPSQTKLPGEIQLPNVEILVVNLLTESGMGQGKTDLKKQFLERLIRKFAFTRFALLVATPGTRLSAQELVYLRNNFLQTHGELKVLGPCLHQKNCPMAQHPKFGPKSWCHQNLRFPLLPLWHSYPPLQKWISRESSFINMSYQWWLKADEAAVLSVPLSYKGKVPTRAVSNWLKPKTPKEQSEIFVCGPEGQIKPQFRNELAEANVDFEYTHQQGRGALLS